MPAALTALGVAGVVLTSRRMHTRDVLALVDWHLLALFIGLFVVVRGFEVSGWTEAARNALESTGADLTHPAVLVIVAEQAERLGLRFSFREHIGTGLPVTLVSLAIAAAMLAALALW